MWLRKFDGNGDEFRYKLETFYATPMMLENGEYTQCFHIYRYYKNNDGEFVPRGNESVLVSIETLLSMFVAIDSPMDNSVKELEEFRKTTWDKNLNESLSPFYLGGIEEPDLNSEQPVPQMCD